MENSSCALAERRIVRLDWLQEHRGVSPKQIHRLMQREGFPTAIKLTDRGKGWWLHEVDAWIDARPRGIHPCKGSGQFTDEAIEERERKRAETLAAKAQAAQ